jgi:hypothetical protein
MRLPWKLLALVASLPPGALLVLAALALQGQPSVTERAEVGTDDIERVVAMARHNDPRRHPPGAARELTVTQRDLELLLDHGSRRWLEAPAVRVRLSPYNARLQASTRLRGLPFDVWLNLDARLREGAPLPELESLYLGRLPVPAWALALASRQAGTRLGLNLDLQIARDVVQRIGFSNGVATIAYTWRADTQDRLLSALVPPDEQARLKVYSDHLVRLAAAATPADGVVSLTDLLPPMFALARTRAEAGGDAAAENRSALLVLAMHASGRRLSTLVPAARSWPRPQGLRMTLHGRDDFPQHFLVSAVLAAEGGGPLSDAIGLFKEVQDSRRGSGFSFNDIAADRAGTRFGALAVRDPQRMQTALNAGMAELELMPDVSDLPEFMAEAEFLRRFGGVGATAYRQMLDDIDARIGATPLLR